MNITNKEQTPGAKSKFSVNIGLMDTHGHSRPKRIFMTRQGPFQSRKKLSLLCMKTRFVNKIRVV